MQIKDRVIFDGITKTAILMRDGIYQYLAAEVGDTSRPAHEIVRVYRDKKEIDKAFARLQELQRLPLTINHPQDFVDLKNDDSYKEGVVTDPFLKQVGDYYTLGAKTSLNDKATLLYDRGIKELSCGWEGRFIKVDHPDYDYVQEFVDFNHVAILPDGRGGFLCSIIDNNLKLLQIMLKEKEEIKKIIKDAVSESIEENKIKDADKSEKEDEEEKEETKDKKAKDKKTKDSDKDEEEEKGEKPRSWIGDEAAIKKAITNAVAEVRTALIADYSSVLEAVSKGMVEIKDCLGKEPALIKQAVVEKQLKKKIDIKDQAILDAHYSVAVENFSHPGWKGSEKISDTKVTDAAAEISNINFLETK